MSRARIFLIALLGALIFRVWLMSEDNPKANFTVTESRKTPEKIEKSQDKTKPIPTHEEKFQRVPLSVSPKDSLTKLSKILFDYSRADVKLKDLVRQLEADGQAPLVTHNANEATGEMAIVRTQAPLPGTRYFHAQFFKDDKHQSFAQHISFEYKPSPSAMKEAVQSLKTAFALGKTLVQNEGYVKWKLDDGHILWVKKMTSNDLKDDPFNAYTAVDVGTVRVAIEAEIH